MVTIKKTQKGRNPRNTQIYRINRARSAPGRAPKARASFEVAKAQEASPGALEPEIVRRTLRKSIKKGETSGEPAITIRRAKKSELRGEFSLRGTPSTRHVLCIKQTGYEFVTSLLVTWPSVREIHHGGD